MGCRRSPFLNMGTTLAVVQSVGIIPCFSEAWKNSVNVGVISSASVLSSLVGMWSGPVALCSLSVHRSLWTERPSTSNASSTERIYRPTAIACSGSRVTFH